MSALQPPEITWYRLTGDGETYDFASRTSMDHYPFQDVEIDEASNISDTAFMQVENTGAEGIHAEAHCAILYLDNVIIEEATPTAAFIDGWVKVRNVDYNGFFVEDEYSPIGTNSFLDYKPLHGKRIAPGMYNTFAVYVEVPSDAAAGTYNWDLVLEYQYTS